MKISVIIPVYNAEKYLKRAVESALKQKETYEIILVEDCSSDNSLKICKELEEKYGKVKLLRHPNAQNKGAGATRNLGIKKATQKWISFLDADDYYLPGRFAEAKKIIEKNKKIDGVYEAIGIHFYDKKAKEQWIAGGGELLTGLHKPVHPDKLFESLVSYKNGYIHLDGLVVKKKLSATCGYFPENLRLHQDTAFILQLSAFGRLAAGDLKEPVALRGIHSGNRITKNRNESETRALLWATSARWALHKKLELKKLVLIYKRYIEATYQLFKKIKTFQFRHVTNVFMMFNCFIRHPIVFISAISILFSQKSIKKTILIFFS
jgi:glycosyltransferase involved in cell wall biosynthesis